MIHIQTRRAGVIVLASTVDGSGNVTQTWALTHNGAEARLCRIVGRR